MLADHYGKNSHDAHPANWYDLVVEHRSNKIRDKYIAAPNSTRAAQGLAKLDSYMAMHKPVMVGVSHTINFFLTQKNKAGHVIGGHEINGGTIDHFVAIVGTGVDKQGKYYPFYDVGTADKDRGTSPSNRLYYNPATGFYEGTSMATYKKYVLAQVRF